MCVLTLPLKIVMPGPGKATGCLATVRCSLFIHIHCVLLPLSCCFESWAFTAKIHHMFTAYQVFYFPSSLNLDLYCILAINIGIDCSAVQTVHFKRSLIFVRWVWISFKLIVFFYCVFKWVDSFFPTQWSKVFVFPTARIQNTFVKMTFTCCVPFKQLIWLICFSA